MNFWHAAVVFWLFFETKRCAFVRGLDAAGAGGGAGSLLPGDPDESAGWIMKSVYAPPKGWKGWLKAQKYWDEAPFSIAGFLPPNVSIACSIERECIRYHII